MAREEDSWSAGVPPKVGLRPGCLIVRSMVKGPGRSETLLKIRSERKCVQEDSVLCVLPSVTQYWWCLTLKELELVEQLPCQGLIESKRGLVVTVEICRVARQPKWRAQHPVRKHDRWSEEENTKEYYSTARESVHTKSESSVKISWDKDDAMTSAGGWLVSPSWKQLGASKLTC